MKTMEEITKGAKAFAEVREELQDLMTSTARRMEMIMDENRRAMHRLVGKAQERRAELEALIIAAPELFTEPRTVVAHGIKFGFRKGKGSLEWADDAQVVKLIKKLFPEQAEVLIKTTEKPVKAALQELPAGDLKRIAVTVEETGDVVLIKPVDGEVEKLVKSLLKGAQDQAGEEAA